MVSTFLLTKAKKISIIESPLEFYSTILEGSRFSKFRIVWSSLYFGMGPLEKFLVHELDKNLRKNRRLKVPLKLTSDKNAIRLEPRNA
jgi:hypothetical protein